jgi:asparagine synthase (glutamine-hydrolysing)
VCGVLAIAGAEHGRGAAGVDAALARLARRGPDGSGVWRSPTQGVLLGHTRLAIIDLTDAGRQPMTDERESVAVVCNGEIYNAPALRQELEAAGYRFRSRSDTEVLVHGYQRWGFAGLLQRLIGMFALLIWDERQGMLLGAVDPAGMKPLYWSCSGGALYAASNADALRCVLPERPRPDGAGLCHVLCLGYCPAPQTVWEGVRKLGPGQAMRFVPAERDPEIWRHWSPAEEIGGRTCDPEQEDREFAALWERVAADHLLSDVPVGLFLSGGLDSSAVALALSRAGADLACLTLSLPGKSDEGPAAAETAAMLGMRHETVPFAEGNVDAILQEVGDVFDEPQAYGACLTAVRIAKAARERGKVIIAGDGGDEAFGGYTWHLQEPRPGAAAGHDVLARAVADPGADGRTRSRALELLRQLSFVHGHLQAVFPRFHPSEAAALLAPLGARYDERTYAAWAGEHDRDGLPWPRRGQRLDLMGFCAGAVLPKIDRSSMGVGLELRAPFLDRRVLDWALRLPVRAGTESKPVLRRYLTGHVPAGVLQRPKQGFSLRLGQDVWTGRLEWLRGTRLMREGVLHEGWEGFVAPDAPDGSSRVFALCMLASWAEGRL